MNTNSIHLIHKYIKDTKNETGYKTENIDNRCYCNHKCSFNKNPKQYHDGIQRATHL